MKKNQLKIQDYCFYCNDLWSMRFFKSETDFCFKCKKCRVSYVDGNLIFYTFYNKSHMRVTLDYENNATYIDSDTSQGNYETIVKFDFIVDDIDSSNIDKKISTCITFL